MSSFLTRRGPRMNSMWTPELEEEFVAMMEAKPELFDTTEMNFSNKTAKMNAWLEMAEHLGLSEKELRKKWDSLRTQYSRYTKMYVAGGPEGRLCTARQQWILQRLKFLDPHIKRRSSYCTDLDYEVTVVENSCDELSPAQVDVELEPDTLHQGLHSDSEANLEAFKPQLTKRVFEEDDDTASTDSPRLQGAKRHCSGEKITVVNITPVAGSGECEDDEEMDAAGLRRIEERKGEDCWDVFGRYVVSCLKSLESSQNRINAQNEVCAVLHKHIERDVEDMTADMKVKQKTSCAFNNSAKASTNTHTQPHSHCEPKAPADQDDLEPFLKSMSITMKRLPENVRAELKFRIHEMVHRAEMKHLFEHTHAQNTPTPGQESNWENGLNYNLI